MEDIDNEVGEAFTRIERLLGARDARVVLADARNDLLIALEAIEDSVQVSDEKTFRFQAHALVGVLSTFGFTRAECLSRSLLNRDCVAARDLPVLREEISFIATRIQALVSCETSYLHHKTA